ELRIQYTGYSAEIRSVWRRFMFDATFLAEKAIGPTNPGDAALENDPGVVGALLMDPNTFTLSSGRTYFDRGYVGKIRAIIPLPGRVELSAIGDYLDGQVFGRRILITGLAQGPSVIAATVRGSPEGGNRAEYVLNWNLRLQRDFRMPIGRITGAVDVMNVLNAGQSLQQSDVGGP